VTLLKIAHIGNPVLRQRAREISAEELASAETQRFIDDLVETMRDANGAGIAAIQVHNAIRLFVVEVKDNPRYPYKPNVPLTIVVNPVITPLTTETFDNFEGCLSVPNLRGVVKRFTRIRVRAWDRHGEESDREIAGVTAGTYQHEVDHLNGVVFLDRVSDPTTFCTWTEFDRYYKDAFAAQVGEIVKRFGS